ncbi:5-formyltetrahydrofolate cyclo-ligase [Clostridium weizhouense]|uniref:5-formyltetrahydrofolate cyclo-ligase n=1 Tax=Clostridium weizhouense TaxID=2859781 RepID=A0ABS7AP76_9CLOT|nr:5-formyltetrahydrofolate cyclo-ligase [Clostridium weizhouense]MBW6410463.1 5-formyltetrahydrofolate cyclo-ligase [Clostridium weizhouense]
MSLIEEKRELRKRILKIRDKISLDNKIKFDKIIYNKFLQSKFYLQSKNIFIYVSYNSEIDTKNIIKKALEDKKNIYVPRTNYKTKVMEAVKILSLENLIEDKYGILEPTEDESAENPNKFDLIIMPGVAFDKYGGRMGYGAGYYDRYLEKISKPLNKVALAYNFQVINKVPTDIHDIPIEYIITEREDINCKK